MMKYPGGHEMVAQVMPPLGLDLCDSVEAYVSVTVSGDVEFIRFCEATNSSVRSGTMDRNMFPSWATEMFAAINIHIADVSSDTTVSTKLPGGALLQENQPEFFLDATWSLRE